MHELCNNSNSQGSKAYTLPRPLDVPIDENPLVSILIPLYNAEEYIGSLLEWCIRQPYKNIEVVVVDDHSTDHSLEIAKRYESERIHILTNPKKGAQSARNYAFQNCHGRFVKFHDADDYCSDNIILRQVERMMKDGDDDTIVFSSLHTIDNYGNIGKEKAYNDKDFDNPIDFLSIGQEFFHIHTPHCFLLTRQTVEKTGGWKEDVLILQDNLFFTKAAEKASKMLYVEDEYAVWRVFYDNQHTHSRSLEKMRNAIHTICDLANTVLKYRNDEKGRRIASLFLGQHIYRDIIAFRPILAYVNQVCQENGLEWTKIKRRRLGFLYATLGWERTSCLVWKWKNGIRTIKGKVKTLFRTSNP